MLKLPADKTYIWIDPWVEPTKTWWADFVTLVNQHVAQFEPSHKYEADSFTNFFAFHEAGNDTILSFGPNELEEYEEELTEKELENARNGTHKYNRDNPLSFTTAWALLAQKGLIELPDKTILFNHWW